MRLFGIMLANGFSSEVSVGSRLLGHSPEIEALLTVHAFDGSVPTTVERVSKARVIARDYGWRPNPDAKRPKWAKAASWARLLSLIPLAIADAKRFSPDVIYSSQQVWDCTLATAVALALGKPQVIHLHYITGPWLGRLPQRRLKECEQVVTVSEFTRRRVISHGASPDRVRTVLNPISLEPARPGAREAVRAELGLSPQHRVLGHIARLSDTKGQLETLQALATFASDVPEARLVLVGDGPARSELEAQSRSLGLHERVVLTGPRRDVNACLAAFDAFVHPSFEDPCPLAVLEAQLSGLPVVAFSDGGIPEIVADGETGLLCPVRDVKALAEAMKRVVTDAELSLRLGVAAAARARSQFDEPTAGARFTAVLSDLLRRRSG